MIDIKNYGFTKFYEEDRDLEKEVQQELIYARVTQVHRDLYKVISEHGECNARIKGSLYNDLMYSVDFPAVGDFILLKYNETGDSQIVKVCRRRSKFSRPDYSGHSAAYVKNIIEQVVAANFDYVFIMASLNKDFNVNRILRYITVAWESGGTPVVILTKSDLVDDYNHQLEQVQNQAIGVDVIALSAVEGRGVEALNRYLEPGKTIVFLGSSGVGKSTLVNTLAGEEVMKVNDIREDDSKGRHTTTYRQLIRLDTGAMIIDTPGMRELGIWDIGDGLLEAFSDIEELLQQCKFSDCTHNNEPGCAIRTAIDAGTLSSSRWSNYLRLKNEAKFTENKAGYLKDKRVFMKKINNDARSRQRTVSKR